MRTSRLVLSSKLLSLFFFCITSFYLLEQDSTLNAQEKTKSQNVFKQAAEIVSSQAVNQKQRSEPVTKTSPFAKYRKGPKPTWIWNTRNAQKCQFRRKFTTNAKQGHILATCDNSLILKLNGKRVFSSSTWESPVQKDVSKLLKEGENEILVEAGNEGSVAGLLVKLILIDEAGKTSHVLSDETWEANVTPKGNDWGKVKTLGKLGVGPWKNVIANAGSLKSSPQSQFQTLPGYQVERLFTVPKNELGSWVSITFDQKGRLLASDQGGKGICRIIPAPLGTKEETIVEKLDLKMTSAQGMLAAFDSLYFSVNGGPGSGLYRARDTNGDDQYDELEKLQSFAGGGEHGPHALRLSPDGKSIYVIAGNHTNMPSPLTSSRIPSNWKEDLLLPRQWDARGHARGKLAPGGWICRTDPDGKTWEVVSMGYRNPYDMDFNTDGELFAYDADMEWDMGTSWYRPTRVVHATSGSEFGWRSGTGKWPTYYPDSLPPAVNIGPGSPTGVTFGTGTKFPAKYQKALYIVDWTFGTIFAIHLTPQGSTYVGKREEFVSRSPLPLTDIAVGPDGALYFTVGGRGTQSELFRVTYTGKESVSEVPADTDETRALRKVRRSLEEFHTSKKQASPLQFPMIWGHLGSPDRFVRYAARIALEHQPVDMWLKNIEGEKDVNRLINAAVAFARQGKVEQRAPVIKELLKLKFAELSETQQLELLRAYALLFVRQGAPDDETSLNVQSQIEESYPAKTDALNRELSRVLVYLNSPKVIDKTLKLLQQPNESAVQADYEDWQKSLLARNGGYGGTIAKMLSNTPEIQKIHYAFVLRNLRFGWTLEQRQQYFGWLNEALEKSGGASYQGFIKNIRTEALANASEAEKKLLSTKIDLTPIPKTDLPKPEGPGKNWTANELVSLAESKLQNRNFEHGKRTFAAAKCIVCHRMDGIGGATGPDLTNVAGRFSNRDLAEALVDPSKVISDQYMAHTIVTTKGKSITGRIASENNGVLTILIDPEDATKIVEVSKDDIDEQVPSKVSLMPKDLLKELNEQEVLDLLAFLKSRGNPRDRMFLQKPSETKSE